MSKIYITPVLRALTGRLTGNKEDDFSVLRIYESAIREPQNYAEAEKKKKDNRLGMKKDFLKEESSQMGHDGCTGFKEAEMREGNSRQWL